MTRVCGQALLIALIAGICGTLGQQRCDPQLRAKYCQGQQSCQQCEIGPTCPVRGQRRGLGATGDDLLLLRGIRLDSTKKALLNLLDQKRMEESISTCVPLFEWDEDLAEIAQAWADQCALVEYDSNAKTPRRLYHDGNERSVSLEDKFAPCPGVAQTVHWVRTEGLVDISPEVLQSLVNSDLTIEDGLIDGLIASPEENLLTWGQATHVGCGWIQFPANGTGAGSEKELENFMVCNYGIGIATRNSCNDTETGSSEVDDRIAYITYYSAPSQVIEDIKSCLNAVQCRKRQVGARATGESCSDRVEDCLAAKSGLKFLQANKLKSVARSGDSPIDIVASKCKIDTILCSLNGTFACKERLRRCLPLLDLLNENEKADNRRPLAECRCDFGLTFADGTVNDCTTEKDDQSGTNVCYVMESPCVAVDNRGKVEVSKPASKLNGLIHTIEQVCTDLSSV